jgi:hypothetical protein
MTFPTAFGDRRNFLRGGGMLGGAAMLTQPTDVMVMLQNREKSATNSTVQAVSEHARATTLPPEAHKLPRWIPGRTGAFDLSRPLDNHFAFAKVQANLAGEYSWLAQYGWVLLAPPGVPAVPWLGKIMLAQIFATAADPAMISGVGPHDYMLWGTFNQVYVDPRTFKPIDTALNPYTGKMIDVPSVDYADKLAFRLGKSIVVPGVEPAFYTQPWDRDGGFSQHFVDTGKEISYAVLGAAQKNSPQQPRVDVGFWTSTREDIMDPSKRSIDCKRDYSSMMKASEYAWMGHAKGDQTQILTHLTGIKTQNPARMPDFIKSLVLDRFKGRYVI